GNALAGGGGGGAPATTNDATWVHTFWPSATWATPGGNFAATPTVTLSMPANGPFSSPQTLAVTAEVQSWLNSPATNFGWLLKTDETLPSTAHRFDSRQSLTASARPVLTVTYLVPGTHGPW